MIYATPSSRALACVLHPCLLSLTIFIGYLQYHNYPLTNPEALFCSVLILVISLGLGSLIYLIRSHRAQAIASLVLLLVAFDLAVELKTKYQLFSAINSLVPDFFIPFLYSIIVFFILLLTLSLSRLLPQILVFTYAVFFTTTLLLPTTSMPFGSKIVAAENLNETVAGKTVLHLLLDGHIGLDAIPVDIDGGEKLKQELEFLFDKWALNTAGKSYSQHILTQDSIATLFNGISFHTTDVILGSGQNTQHRFRLNRNEYFEYQKSKGFDIHVFQTDYIDFCSTPNLNVEKCRTFPAVSPRAMVESNISTQIKFYRLLRTFFNQSFLVFAFDDIFLSSDEIPDSFDNRLNRPHFQELRAPFRYFNVNFEFFMQELEKSILELETKKNTLIFAHLLVPHSPYLWDSHCRPRMERRLWLPPFHQSFGNLEDLNNWRVEKYYRYFEQTTCLIKALDQMFERLSEEGVYEGLDIVLHGDHGSRLSVVKPVIENKDLVSRTDVLDAYSTLFATNRIPKFDYQNTEQLSLIELFSIYDLLPSDKKEVSPIWFRTEDTIYNEIRWQADWELPFSR